MSDDEEILKKRFIELAKRAERQSIYLYTPFLGLGEQTWFHQIQSQLPGVPYSMYGGSPGCERVIVRFGSEETTGYTEDFPISALIISPDAPGFAEDLGHRDYLGALLNLGLDRSTLGDIFISAGKAYLYCQESIAPFICENLTRVRHTQVTAVPIDEIPAEAEPKLDDRNVNVASERLDAVIAAVYRISRSQASQLIRSDRVFVNGILTENVSQRPKEDDIISVRGRGRFIYAGIAYETKKGRYGARVRVYS